MGIKIKRDGKGGYRRWWYAEYKEDGKLRIKRLDVKVAGTPPVSLSIREDGDMRYERASPSPKRHSTILWMSANAKGQQTGSWKHSSNQRSGRNRATSALKSFPTGGMDFLAKRNSAKTARKATISSSANSPHPAARNSSIRSTRKMSNATSRRSSIV